MMMMMMMIMMMMTMMMRLAAETFVSVHSRLCVLGRGTPHI